MIDCGNYMMPAYNVDRVNLNKPPMTAWVIAGSIAPVRARTTWAVRTPMRWPSCSPRCCCAAWAAPLVPDKPWLPGLVYACTLFPFLAANIVSTDVFLTLFEALAVLRLRARRSSDVDARPSATMGLR